MDSYMPLRARKLHEVEVSQQVVKQYLRFWFGAPGPDEFTRG